MTQSTATTTRTLAQIEAGLVGVRKMLDDVDAFLRDLRNAPCKGDEFVVGFPQYGRFVNRRGELVRVDKCALLFDRSAAYGMRVTNGKGEVAQVMRYGHALDVVIDMQEDLHTMLCGCLQDLHAERTDRLADYAEASDEDLCDMFDAGDNYAWDVFVARRFVTTGIERERVAKAEAEHLDRQAAEHAFTQAQG